MTPGELARDAPPCGVTDFNPDAALEEIRKLTWGFGTRLAYLIGRLDDHLCGGCGALPQDWQPDPGVIVERVMRNQPRRTSRAERRGGAAP